MDKNYFFVLALPRSRTSWVANLLNYSNSFCYHEALRECSSLDELKDLLDSHEEEYVGNSDSALVPYFYDLIETFPNAKILLIERKPHEVVESLLDFQLTDNYVKTENWINKLHQQIKEIKRHPQVLTVKHTDFNELEKCKEIWEYLLPTIPFNEKRLKFLDDLYVNIHATKTFLRTYPNSLHLEFSRFTQ